MSDWLHDVFVLLGFVLTLFTLVLDVVFPAFNTFLLIYFNLHSMRHLHLNFVHFNSRYVAGNSGLNLVDSEKSFIFCDIVYSAICASFV